MSVSLLTAREAFVSGSFVEGDVATGPRTEAFGDVSTYLLCACCAGFHAVFEPGGDGPTSLVNGDDRGGVNANGKVSLSTGDAGAQLTRGNLNWLAGGPLGQPLVLTYSFRSTGPATMPEETTDFSRFTETQIAATLLALQSWADVANITFQRVDDGDGYSNNATMVFGNYSSGANGSAAFAYSPGNRAATSVSGDVWVNVSLAYNAAPVMLGYGQQVLTHEIGHAIGLRHPAEYNAAEGVSITYATNATYFEDSRQYTVMSYFNESNTGANFRSGNVQQYSAVPLLDDIAAAQRLYGANMATRTGDTVYGFNSNAGQSWFSASSGALIFAVWDAGGVDTLDFSGYSQAQVIDLRQAAFSNVGGLIGNVAVAVGAVIENAIGGSGADILMGNSGANVLTGGGGNDRIDGGLGSDTVVFSGNRAQYTITWNGNIGTVVGLDGTDTITNVEFLRFADQTIAATPSGGLIVGGDLLNNSITGTAFADSLGGLGGDDLLDGVGGNDVLDGGFGNDTLFGGQGDDVLIGGFGVDTLVGGEGFDAADYSGATGGVVVNLGTGASSGAAGSDSLTGIEEVRGSAFDDILLGDDLNNVLRGNGGSDILSGGGGNDVLFAGTPGLRTLVKSSAVSNSGLSTSVSLDESFVLAGRANVIDSGVIPHASVRAVTHGGLEYYGLSATGGVAITIDIDNAGFDSVVRILDANGNILATNDDGSTANDSGLGTDSALTFTVPVSGVYYVEVSRWVSGAVSDSTLVTAPPPAGATYTLNVSVPGHPVVSSFVGSTLNGGEGADLLNGNNGSDTIRGDGGDDAIYGGGGDDDIDGGAGTDTAVYGGPRSAYSFSTANGVTTVVGPDGTDVLRNVERLQFDDRTVQIGVPEGVNLFGTAGDDVLTGSAGDDVVTAGDGNDVLFGQDGNDILYGGAGIDQLNGGAGLDTAWYENGVAGGYLTIDLAAPSQNNGEAFGDTYDSIERVVGSIGDDIIRGTAGANFFIGREGNDIFLGRGGGDAFDGGTGLDTVWYDQAAIVDLRDPATNGGAAAGDSFNSIERVVGSEQDDVVRGTSATDYFVGRGGNDVFQGRGGGDIIDGGAGLDTVWYDEAAVVDLRDWITNAGSATGDRYDSIERVVGSDAGDIVRGTAGTDYFVGRGGNDVFQGRGGGDVVDGGAGLDTIWFDDAAVVDLAGLTANGGAAAGDNYSSVERVVGSNAADIVRGTTGSDYFVGRDGDDIFLGRGGGDVIDGGAGLDTVWYDQGVVGGTLLIDLVSFGRNTGAASGDQYTSIERVVSSNMNDYVLGTNERDFVLARHGDDVIEGRGGDDVLDAGAGNDRIAGGAGADLLTGGAGADAFIYFAAAEGGDAITDFQSGVDKFEFHNFNLTGNAWFVAGAGPTSAQAQLIWDAATNRLLWDSDGTGAGGAVLIATLQAGATLTAGDISRIQNGVPQGALEGAPKTTVNEGHQTLPHEDAGFLVFDDLEGDAFVVPGGRDGWPAEVLPGIGLDEFGHAGGLAFSGVIGSGHRGSWDRGPALWDELDAATTPNEHSFWSPRPDWDV